MVSLKSKNNKFQRDMTCDARNWIAVSEWISLYRHTHSTQHTNVSISRVDARLQYVFLQFECIDGFFLRRDYTYTQTTIQTITESHILI